MTFRILCSKRNILPRPKWRHKLAWSHRRLWDAILQFKIHLREGGVNDAHIWCFGANRRGADPDIRSAVAMRQS